jgi:hypothetical protein
VVELSNKYVELSEFKKFSCLNIDTAVPLIKVSAEDEDDGLSEAKLEQIKLNKRKRRRYKNSFFNADNLIMWKDQELNI